MDFFQRIFTIFVLIPYFFLGCANSSRHAEAEHVGRVITNADFPEDLTSECREFIKSLPTDFGFNFIQVPENWDQHKDSLNLRIFYYYYKPNETVAPSTIFFNGGPGFSGHNLLSAWKVLLPKYKIPMIFIDQRGTGCSSPYPQIVSDTETDRFSHYGSRAIVRDAEAIRKTLLGENSKWQIFGQSYGGLIVHRYLTLYPENIKSVYSHGFAISNSPLGPYYEKMLGQNRIAEQYFASHSEVRNRLILIRQKIKSSQCFSKNTFKICGDGILDGILAAYFNANLIKDLEVTSTKLILPTGDLDLAFLNELASKHVISVYASADTNSGNEQEIAAQNARKYIGKMEMDSGISHSSDPAHCKAIFRKLVLKGQRPNDWILNPCRFIISIQKAKISAQVKADPLDLLNVKKFISQNPSISFYLYSGSLDSFEPSELFQDESKKIPRIRYTNFSNSGHEGFVTEPQVWKDLLASKTH